MPPRRRKALAQADRGSLILWGALPSVPARNIWDFLKARGVEAASVAWRGQGPARRHLVLVFRSELS